MTTSLPKTIFPNDGPCCGGQTGDDINYTDNGNLWTLQGDIDVGGSPNGAWTSANSSGLSITYNTCIYAYISEYSTSGYVCGPHHEYLQGEGPYDSSIYGDLGAIPVCPPSTCGNRPLVFPASSYFGSRNFYPSPSITPVPNSATVFSIDVNLPYHNFYSTCQQDTQSNSTDPFAPLNDGCTYESTIGPYDSASLGFDVGGNYDIVGIAEVCPCTSTANSLQMFAYTSNGGASITKILNITTISDFTPFHKLTVATDRRTFVDFYVDNALVYSSSTMPIEQSTNYGGVIEFTTRTNINHEADIVTFSNAAIYSNSTVTATNLPSRAVLSVAGPNGFSANETADPYGKAVVDVSAEPTNLTVGVKSNGKTIATYAQPVDAGAVLNLSLNASSGVILPSFLPAVFAQLQELQATAFIASLIFVVGLLFPYKAGRTIRVRLASSEAN